MIEFIGIYGNTIIYIENNIIKSTFISSNLVLFATHVNSNYYSWSGNIVTYDGDEYETLTTVNSTTILVNRSTWKAIPYYEYSSLPQRTYIDKCLTYDEEILKRANFVTQDILGIIGNNLITTNGEIIHINKSLYYNAKNSTPFRYANIRSIMNNKDKTYIGGIIWEDEDFYYGYNGFMYYKSEHTPDYTEDNFILLNNI